MSDNNNERLLRAKEVAGYLGIGVSTVWLWVKQNKIPKPFKLTPSTTVWRHSDIQEFIRQQTSGELTEAGIGSKTIRKTGRDSAGDAV